jgi:hypothetical protein
MCALCEPIVGFPRCSRLLVPRNEIFLLHRQITKSHLLIDLYQTRYLKVPFSIGRQTIRP